MMVINRELTQVDQTRQIKGIVSDIQAAAKLRRSMFQLELDNEDRQNNRDVYYAVDTNIFYLYMADPSNPSVVSLGRIFPTDPPRTCRHISQVLAHYIFEILPEELSGSQHGQRLPLLLLPGHDQEVRRYHDRLISSDADEMISFADRRTEIEGFIREAAEANTDKQRELLLDFAREEVRRLIYETSGDKEQSDRFSRLLSTGSYRKLDAIIGHPGFKSFTTDLRGTKGDLYAANTPRQMFELAGYRVMWRDRLRALNPQGRGVELDALALSRLELINRSFRQANSDKRLVLITGAPTIHQAAAEAPGQATGRYEGLSFGDLYIRSPAAFLASRKVLKPNVATTEPSHAVTEWLDAYLAQFLRRTIGRPSREGISALSKLISPDYDSQRSLEDSAREAFDSDPKVRKDRIKVWGRHVKSLDRAHSSASEIALVSFRRGGVADALEQYDLRELISLTGRLVAESWEQFLDIIVRSGFEFIRRNELDQHAPYRRTVPPIVFSEPRFSAIADFARNAAMRSLFDNIEIEGLKQKFRSVRAADPTGYSSAIFMSLLFALADHPDPALKLARNAISIVERLKAESPLGKERSEFGLSGREAYFLAAALARPLVSRPDSFGEVFSFLDKHEEARGWHKQNSPEDVSTGLRGAAERQFAEVARQLFYYVGSTEWTTPPAETRAKQLRKIILNIDSVWENRGTCPTTMVVKITQRRLECYGIVALALLEKLDRAAFSEDLEKLGKKWRKRLNKDYVQSRSDLGEKRENPNFSFFASAALIYANNRFRSKKTGAPLWLADENMKLRERLRLHGLEVHMTDYDPALYGLLLSSPHA